MTFEESLEAGYAELDKGHWVDISLVHRHFFEALEEALAAGDKSREAAARLALGKLRLRVPDGLGALAYFELARDLYRAAGNRPREIEAEQGIGEAFGLLGLLGDARDAFERAAALGADSADEILAVEARALAVVARMFVAQGAYDEAIRHLERVHEIAARLDDPGRRRESAVELGDLYSRVGRYDKAVEVLLTAEASLGAVEPVDGATIRDFFEEIVVDSDVFLQKATAKFIEVYLRMIETMQEEMAEQEEPADPFQFMLVWMRMFQENVPTLKSDPDFGDRRLAIARQLPFGSGSNQPPPGITPRIRWRVVTSFRIFEHLIDDCGALYEVHSGQVTAVTERLAAEIPGLTELRQCKKRGGHENAAGCGRSAWFMPGGQLGFWDIEPPWPVECGDLDKHDGSFNPHKVAEVPAGEMDPDKASWEDYEKQVKEKFPELETMTVDEVIALKERSLEKVNLSFRGGFFKNLKKTVVEQFRGPFQIFELRIYKMQLEIREQGLWSIWAEVGMYWHLELYGAVVAEYFRAIEEKHSETIEGMCHQAFETQLRDRLSHAFQELGPSYGAEAESAAAAAWSAQEPLWEGLGYFGLRPQDFTALREMGNPTMVFAGCENRHRWLSVNQRRVAMWRARLSLEEGDHALAAALFYGAWKGGSYLTRTNEPELEIEALIGLGEAFAGQEMPAIAAIYYQEAIGLVESIQGALREEAMTMSFADAQTRLYGRMVDLLYEMDEKEFTFEYFGRAQARAFLDMIGNERLDLRGVPEDVNRRWNEVRAELAENQRLEKELAGSFSFGGGGSERRDLKKRRDELEARQEEITNELRRRHPGAASFVSVEPVAVESLAGYMVEPETTVVAYFLTPTRGLAWVIERGSSEIVELVLDPEEVATQIEEVRGRITLRESPDELLEELYAKLVTPLAGKIHHERLIVVPYGVLHQLPFTALRDPQSGRYLVEQHSVTLLPSATVMTYVQDRRNPWEKRLLAIGNPDGSLPAAEGEATAIATLYSAEPLLGTAAMESTVRDAAGALDVLHVAAHGRFSEERPRSGYLALASGKAGDPRDDGRLEVIEILNEIDLADSNLVVLSVCNSSVGRRNRGDDILSMPRALLYAGSPTVVSTLWSIDDEASAELMEGFHRHLQENGTGVAEALRGAQVELLAASATASPYYWAGFTLTGDQVSRGAPPERKPGENPWTWNPFAEDDARELPPPFVATVPAVLPWSEPVLPELSQDLLAAAEALLAEGWAFGDHLAYGRFHQALAAAERSGEVGVEAASRLGLARLRARAGDASGALAHIDLAEAIYSELGDEAGLVAVERAYGETWQAWGALAESRAAFEEALARGTGGDDRARADTHEALAGVLELEGSYGWALHHLEEARRLRDELGLADEALVTGVIAGEMMSSISRDERAVGLLEAARGQMTAQPAPALDPDALAATLGTLDGLTEALGARVDSWLAHAWSEDPFADWDDPPTVRDEVFTERRREYLTDLPDFLAGREGSLAITPIHHEFAMSPGVFMRLIRDCAFLHMDYGDDIERLKSLESSTGPLRADWPAECGPRRQRFDPRYVEHTLDGSLPDETEGSIALAVWRGEREKQARRAAQDALEPDWNRLTARQQDAVEAMRNAPGSAPRDDPSLLFSDKKIVYYLLGATLPDDLLAERSRHLESLDRMCRQDLEVRVHNALWRSYSRLGEEPLAPTKAAREAAAAALEAAAASRLAAWQAAAPLWQAWTRLGWVSSSWEASRDAGLPAPILGSCRSVTRGVVDRREIDVWRAESAFRQGESSLARAWYRRAADAGAEETARSWPASRPTTTVSALVGLAELYAAQDRPGLAAIHYRNAIARVESVAEGFRPEELAAAHVDVRGLYERVNGLLDELGESDLEFQADLRDGACPDRFVDDPLGLDEDLPPRFAEDREELCLDLVALHNREVALLANPLAVAGYQGPGNSLEGLRRQRIGLENALRQFDYEVHFPPSEKPTEDTSLSPLLEQIVMADEIATAEIADAEIAEEEPRKKGRFAKFLPGGKKKDSAKKSNPAKKSGGLFGGGGAFGGLKGKFQKVLLDKATDVIKRQGRLIKSRRRAKKSRRDPAAYEGILGVTLFQRGEYRGLSEKFTDDDPSLRDNTLLHDTARSVKIDPGCRVVLYENADFEGFSTTLRNDTAVLADTVLGNDAVSSLRVVCR